MSETLLIIGREPELSVAELEAVAKKWQAEVVDVNTTGVLLRHDQPLPTHAIDQLGGSLKQVEVLECFDLAEKTSAIVTRFCTPDWLAALFPAGRIEYGVSIYNLNGSERSGIQKHFLSLKKEIKGGDRPVRFVTSREPQLSSVTVQRNGLVKKGKEFIFWRSSQSLVLGVTTATQDYQSYSLRDFGRPSADPKSGMLPPKLAQIMLNIAGAGTKDVLLDPFCGTGTVLQEAALFGVEKIYGSDSQPRAVKDSQENIRWLMKEFSNIKTDVEINVRDAREVKVRPNVIVTEPYLGKPLRGHEPLTWLNQQKAELEKLYLQCFQHWKKILPAGGRIVMIWPKFVTAVGGTPPKAVVVDDKNIELQLDQVIAGLGYVRQRLLTTKAAAALNVYDPLVLEYGREDARVRRQVRKWIIT